MQLLNETDNGQLNIHSSFFLPFETHAFGESLSELVRIGADALQHPVERQFKFLRRALRDLAMVMATVAPPASTSQLGRSSLTGTINQPFASLH